MPITPRKKYKKTTSTSKDGVSSTTTRSGVTTSSGKRKFKSKTKTQGAVQHRSSGGMVKAKGGSSMMKSKESTNLNGKRKVRTVTKNTYPDGSKSKEATKSGPGGRKERYKKK